MKNKKWTLVVITAMIMLTITACNLPQASEAIDSALAPALNVTAAQEETTSESPEEDVAEVQEEVIISDLESEDTESLTESEVSDPAYAYQTDILLDDEVSDLIWMREEEKLARDVYLTLFEIWDLNIFKNIASSEQKHTDAVKTLLDAYELPDIVADDTVGVFANSELQKLYDDLVEKGSQSLAEALLVGGLIEELDILDLQEAIEKTEREDILQVYNNLLNGSYNHLQAFVSNYERQADESYSPQLMSIEVFEEAYSASPSRGRGTSNQP